VYIFDRIPEDGMKKLIIILLLIPGALIYAQEVDYVSSTLYSGYFQSLSIQSSYAYCGAGNSFQILSIADPENPEFVAGYPLPGDVYDVALDGEYIFIIEHIYSWPSNYHSFLKSYRFSQPNTLIQLDSIEIGDFAYSIAVSGNYAFIPAYDDRLVIVDIFDPWNLNIIGQYDIPGYEEIIEISGDYAFVATSIRDLTIIDISDVQNITTVGVYDSTRGTNSICVRGNYVYLAQVSIDPSPGLLTIVDISNPESPTFTGRYILPADAWGIYVEGDYAYTTYAGEYGYGLVVVDVSDPTSPNLVGNYGDLWGSDINIEFPYCYLVGGYDEPSILNISVPQNPQLVGQYDTPGFIRAVDVGDSLTAYGQSIFPIFAVQRYWPMTKRWVLPLI